MSKYGPLTYTNEECEIIEKMVRDGYSASQIGNVIGRSRNAIIGFVCRHLNEKGIGLSRSKGSTGAYARRRLSDKNYYKPTGNRPGRPKGAEVVSISSRKQPAAKARKPAIEPKFLKLEDLTARQCRFACNDADRGEEHLFCGHLARINSAWCDYHRAVVYVPEIAKSRRKRANVLAVAGL